MERREINILSRIVHLVGFICVVLTYTAHWSDFYIRKIQQNVCKPHKRQSDTAIK